MITLALILATLDQLPAPEDPIFGTPRTVMTPLAFRHFPSSEYVTARTEAFRGTRKSQFPRGPQVPSLTELLLHQLRVSPLHRILESEQDLEARQLWRLYMANTPFYHHYSEEMKDKERVKRNKNNPGPRVMYMTAATLIVVPANLIRQWENEIHKHCDSVLRFLVLRRKTDMPSAKSLASNYDVSTLLPS